MMNCKISLYLMLIVFLSACGEAKSTGQTTCENEKAKAILWVDRTDNESLQEYGFIRTAKVRVNVYSYNASAVSRIVLCP